MTDERLPEEIERAIGLVDDTAAEWGIFKGSLQPRIQAIEALRRAILAGMLEARADQADITMRYVRSGAVGLTGDGLRARAKTIREGR